MMIVPKPITVNTGEQEMVQPIADKFFEEVRDFVLSQYNLITHNLKIESGEIACRQGQITDDRITYLRYMERFVLAGVLETRTEANQLHYTFFESVGSLEGNL